MLKGMKIDTVLLFIPTDLYIAVFDNSQIPPVFWDAPHLRSKLSEAIPGKRIASHTQLQTSRAFIEVVSLIKEKTTPVFVFGFALISLAL